MKIGIVGCAGRMGRMLMNAVLEAPGCQLAGGTDRPGTPTAGQDLGALLGRAALGLTVGQDAKALFAASDAIIDFTAPAATVAHAALAAELGKILVVGTTGLTKDDEAVLAQAAARTTIVYAPNFSVGVNLLMALTERAAAILGDDYDIEIVEMHHRRKVDAPSGTALGLGRSAAKGRGVALDQVWCKSRDGHTGARPKGEIGFATLRGGDVVGDHTVMFAAEEERVELTHKAASRAVFAKGAVRAARWAGSAKPGLYSMRDVLGL
ncbi:4-hydroxy-tetrahydrodipicolinate reductase [Magnetospirillum moscoviense]|uniref:4-hydroxy-tetrahydrodipicolinate reductase n=1 Tax=Magnetospirillum moscoviense TaxID=1437059 RepID=A0A178MMP3_9PROT|nr:4-hydroxy-tetrahydrodipicolinate reductase [Magnetospirillum moscoviense]OAN49345.1 4-hydroxy-tetrahydrodipicolinate reductase [Magnetospirillum moscoviense]